MPKFKLVSDFKPTGDQPQAIAKLVEGLRKGYKHQTLLGATGTGKSLAAVEPVWVYRRSSGGDWVAQLIPIGELVDEVLAASDTVLRIGNTEYVEVAADKTSVWTLSFNPKTARVEYKPVTAFIRHSAPSRMYRIRTACGRQALVTGDHNLWVLREGTLTLLPTEALRATDFIPLPRELENDEADLEMLDLVALLAETPLFVEANQAILAAIQATNLKTIADHLRDYYISPYAKLSLIRRGVAGARIPIRTFRSLLRDTDGWYGQWNGRQARIAGKLTRCDLPAQLPITDDFLRLLGYYIAEGNSQPTFFIWANHSPELRHDFEAILQRLNIPFSVRASSDYQVSSKPLVLLLRKLCGSKARTKHLPPFWPQLSKRQLGVLLRAYFDCDGGVERASYVNCITASPRLANDLAYALARFGIWARVRKRWKRATNSQHAGAWYWQVSISGQENLRRFAEHIGFSLPSKACALERQRQKAGHSNVDVIPCCHQHLRWLREKLGVSKKLLAERAGLSRSAIQLFEKGARNPRQPTMIALLQALHSLADEREPPTQDWWRRLRYLENLCRLRWTPVASVEVVPYDQPFVYDLQVLDNETFLAGFGGMFIHNTYVMANVIERVQRPTLVIAHNKTLAAQLYAEFREFFPYNAVEYFVSYYDYYQPEAYLPQYDLYIEKDADINEEIDRLRLAATSALMSRRDVIIVASVSCIYGIGDPKEYGKVVINLRRGEVRKRDKVLRHLVDIHYERNDVDFARGRFRVRGDTLEVFPAYGDLAYRIEFWGDEIDRITEIDPLTGEVLAERESVTIYPAKHFITPREKLEVALRSIEAELEERLAELRAQGKLLEAQRLEQRTRYDLEMLREVGYCAGIENYSRHLSQRPPGSPPWTLIDYFPDDFLMFIDESHMTIPQLRGMYHGDISRKKTLVEYGFRLPSALDNRPLSFEEFEQRINQVIYTSATPGPYELEHSQQVVEQIIRPTGLVDPEVIVKPTKGQIDDLIHQIDERVKRGERALVTTLTKRMAEDLADYLAEMGIKVHYLHSEIDTIERVEILRDLRLGVYDVVVGINLLREGLDLPEVSLVAILDADKEGFLRSETALIQTIGRAARHVDGQVIMYADNITESMRRAIEETNRRRRIQMQYNREHGIEPRSIVKEVRDLTDRVRAVAEERAEYRAVPRMPKDEVARLIKDLERQMKAAAKALEFEKAALLRDQIFELRRELLDMDEDVPEWERIRKLARGDGGREI